MAPAGYYFRCYNGKRNFAPPADQSDWFELKSVTLRNGDDVGVATVWPYPGTLISLTPETVALVIDEIDQGLPHRQRYSNDNAAKKRAAWQVVQKHRPAATASQCRQMVTTWITKELLYEYDYDDPIARKKSDRTLYKKTRPWNRRQPTGRKAHHNRRTVVTASTVDLKRTGSTSGTQAFAQTDLRRRFRSARRRRRPKWAVVAAVVW
jgi:hypothetical protein